MRLSLGAACADPVSGDVIVCPPGTMCDPMGSNTCVGVIAQGAAECPLDVNLTGYTPCECPIGYEVDADLNQCVVQGVSTVTGMDTTAPEVADTTTSSGLSTTLLILAAIGIFIFAEGKKL